MSDVFTALLVWNIPEEPHKGRELTAIGSGRRKLEHGSSGTIRMTESHQVAQTRSLRHLELKELCQQLRGL